LVLDEIGEIDRPIHVKLLRFLGERTLNGWGRQTLAPTFDWSRHQQNLPNGCRPARSGRICSSRLRVVEIQTAALRDGAWISHCWRKFSAGVCGGEWEEDSGFHGESMKLDGYRWPGNVRELRTSIDTPWCCAAESALTLRDLPATVRDYRSEAAWRRRC